MVKKCNQPAFKGIPITVPNAMNRGNVTAMPKLIRKLKTENRNVQLIMVTNQKHNTKFNNFFKTSYNQVNIKCVKLLHKMFPFQGSSSEAQSTCCYHNQCVQPHHHIKLFWYTSLYAPNTHNINIIKVHGWDVQTSQVHHDM